MGDIYLGIATICLLAVGLFVLASRIARRPGKGAVTGLALLAAGGVFLHVFVLWDNLRLTRVLPFSNLIVLGNWLPLAVGLLAGLAWERAPGPRRSRLVAVLGLTLPGLYLAYVPIFEKQPASENIWVRGVCMQTSAASCSAACAATLLRHYGIRTTEAEMARLCFTSRRGTTRHGLYRGLKIKTAGTPWDVEVFWCDVDQLRAQCPPPALLFVELPEGADVDPRYIYQWGWIPGVRHVAVLFRFLGRDEADMGDPAVGRELWSVDALNLLWHGEGIRLVPRAG